MSNNEDYDEQEDIEHSNAALGWLLVIIIVACLCVLFYEAYQLGFFDGIISFFQNLF